MASAMVLAASVVTAAVDWVGPNLWSAPPAPDGQTEVLGESKMSDRFKHCFGSCGVACKTDAPFDSPLCTDLPLSPASNYCIALKSTLHLHGGWTAPFDPLLLLRTRWMLRSVMRCVCDRTKVPATLTSRSNPRPPAARQPHQSTTPP